MARGGKRTPAKPAAVSGPGALSRRTDGGAGSDSQPLRSFPAESYGQRQQLRDLQSSAPMAARNGGAPGSSAPSGGGGAPMLPPDMSNGILGPTQRPTEPITAGLGQPRVIPRDPDLLLREIYRQYPHPDIARLLQ